MVKVQNIEDPSGTIRKIEGMILEKLLTRFNQQTPLTSDEELRHSLTEASKSPFYESALENLIREGFVSRIGYNEFQLTPNGVEEHTKRLNERTLF